MTGPDEFKPRLGRIRDRGRGGGKRLGRLLRRAVARLPKPGTKRGFTGARHGAGGAARGRARPTRHLARQRVRRVVVKIHIARAGKGAGLYRAHLGYIQRDGVDRNGEGGRLYDRAQDEVEAKPFLERSEGDRHQFRLIVSPEDGVALGDLKPVIREFMARAERDTGRRLDWVAVDHHNTGHQHTHIVIRGRDTRLKDVVITKDYLMHGLREAAEDIVTRRLGPRRDLEILRARNSEVDKDRLTGIDRALERASENGLVVIGQARSEAGRFERHLALARLRHLSALGLAEETARNAWMMKPGWTETLRQLERRGDIIRALAHTGRQGREVSDAAARPPGAAPVIGAVLGSGPEDELRDRRFLLVEDFKGQVWHVPAAAIDPDNMPPHGAVVEISCRRATARPADRTIAAIAERSGGVWSDALHAEADPGSTPAYRLAHKRRLETLRRAGIAARLSDGTWEVPPDFLERAAAFEAGRSQGLKLKTLSWLALDMQVTRRAETWLDSAQANTEALSSQRRARQAFLQTEGLIPDGAAGLPATTRAALRREELSEALAREAAASGREAFLLEAGDRFDGRLERHVDLAQGRMAVIGHQKAFVMVSWRDGFGRQIGRELTIERTVRGYSWTISSARQRGLER